MGEVSSMPASNGAGPAGETAPPASPATSGTLGSPGPDLAGLWQDGELKGSKSLARYKSVDDLGKAYVALEKQMGERGQAASIPKADATPEQQQAFWQQLPGYPKSADGYQVAPPELPEETGGWDQGFVQRFLEGAHNKGFTTAQAQYIFDFYAGYLSDVMDLQRNAEQTQISEADTGLRQLWGVNTDQHLKEAEAYLMRHHGDNNAWWQTLLTKTSDGRVVALRNVPGFIQMAQQLARLTGADKFVLGDGQGGFLTPETAQERLSAEYTRHRKGEITSAELTTAIERYQPIISSRR